MKSLLIKLYRNARRLNGDNILSLLEPNGSAKLLDLGCNDGGWTIKLGLSVRTSEVYGMDISEPQLQKSEMLGIKIRKGDLNDLLPYENEIFDVVHSNQVIEHISNSDSFLAEIYRVLKPGGYAVISTENASSWCNIFASILGWQIFSLTNFSRIRLGIGNPLALHMGEAGISDVHNRIYNIRGLKEYFEVFGFKVEKILGAGYFPLPAWFGNLDKIHCHFITFKIRKAAKFSNI